MKKPIYMDIKDKIVAYIKENRFQPGDRLPSYREFAELFGVSTNTVGNALERLHYKGVVDIYPQSGLFVKEEAWNALNPNTFNWNTYLRRSKDLPMDSIKRFTDSRERYNPSNAGYVISNIGLSPEFGWHSMWKDAVRKAVEHLPAENLFLPQVEDLRRISSALSEHMKYSGLDIPEGEILLTKGTYYSFQLIAQTFFSPGAVCYYISPSFLDVAALFFDNAGFIREPVPADNGGVDLEYFSERIKKGGQAFLVVMPELSISGSTMSLQKRRELYQICCTNGIPIIELDEYRDYRSESLPPIKALDKHGIVFYVGSFKNILNDSADAGWIAAGPELIERLSYVRLSMWIGYEIFTHQTVYEMLAGGEYRRYVKKLQTLMREREKKLNALLDGYLGDIAVWNRQSEVFFWVKFKDFIDVRRIADNKDGLTMADYSQFAFAKHNSVMICLMSINEADLEPAVRLLSFVARKSIKP